VADEARASAFVVEIEFIDIKKLESGPKCIGATRALD
jgi:hypothetical protein